MSRAQTLTPVALYARTSTTIQEDADQSLQAQLDAMRDYAERESHATRAPLRRQTR